MKGQVISFHCVLTDKVGKVISSTFNQDVITHAIEQGEYLHGLSEGLKDLKVGEKRRITLTAPEAYGFYDLSLVIEIPRKKLTQGDDYQIGDQVSVIGKDKKLTVFRVVQATSKRLTLDGNHPLAGQDLTFDIEGVQTREATSEELAEAKGQGENLHYH